MTQAVKFSARSTADRVLAGIDLTGKHILVTGCSSGIGFETISALAANGAHVIAAARTLREAVLACKEVGYQCSPLACDLGDLESVAGAAEAVRRLQVPLDAIIANAGVANISSSRVRYGVEEHFLVNHVGHFALINDLAVVLRENTGRIVMVTSRAAGIRGVADGIMFDNLAGQQFYDPGVFYAHSTFANALYAKELSRRLKARGIAVNSVNPGEVRGTGLRKNLTWGRRLAHLVARPFMRTAAQGAATIALLAASPKASGISGEYWQDCAIAHGNALLDDGAMADLLWKATEEIVAEHTGSYLRTMAQAA